MRAHLLYKEKVLLEQVAQGDEVAFKKLFDTYRQKLYYYVLAIIKSKEIAEEIVLDVFLKIWIGRDSINDIHNFNAFLHRIAYHKAIDFLRIASRTPSLTNLLWQNISGKQAESQLAGDDRADNKVIMEEYETALHKAISLLPPRRKQVYQLSREEDLTHEQIAAQLHLSRHTVNNHIVEARRFIQAFLISQMNLIIIVFLLSVK